MKACADGPYRFSFFARRSTLAVRTILAVLTVQACDAYSTGQAPAPAFALSLGAATLSLTPGGTTTTSIRATRSGGLTSAISYTVTGAPDGLTVTIADAGVSDSSTLIASASATLAAGIYPISVNAAAPGALSQQVTVAVTVSIPPVVAPAIQFMVTGAHSCALTTTGAAYCWGYNATGQLGNPDTSFTNPVPVPVVGGLTFQSLSVSRVLGVTCGLTTDGAAYCWGANDAGQLGDGTTTSRLTPTPVAGGLTFRTLAVGNDHVCGVVTDGTAYCWGTSIHGAFGDGTVGVRLTPAVAAPGMTFQSIVAGPDYTCALTPAGVAFCWGRGVFGQLGSGAAGSSTTPVAVSGELTFRSLVAGGLHACSLTSAGHAYCWGRNVFGEVGDSTTARRLAPVRVAGGLTLQSLSAGYQTTCGVTDAGDGYCWGYNAGGGVGDGTFTHRSRPVSVQGGLTFQSISAGTGYSCGLTTNNAVHCWGDNPSGELGDGTLVPHATPAPVRWP